MARSVQTRSYRHDLEKQIGFSQAVQSHGFLFLSGLVSMDADGQCIGRGDMSAQVQAIYTDVGRILYDYGLTFEAVVKETIYTTDMQALLAAVPARLKFFENVAPPAATWVRVAGLFSDEYLLEVEITAELPAAEPA
jgi:2-iminobutanoate/2-iminopropanoate deaminase